MNRLLNRKLIFLLIPVFLGFQACSDKKETKTSSEKPNIVLIVSDDHGQNDLGCYGNMAIETPNLDELASEGIRFTNAYCTTASCSSSRSTILTGAYSHANGMLGLSHQFHHFSSYHQVKSLPVLLHDLAGYKTVRIGKYHVAPEKVFHFDLALNANARNSGAMADSCLDFLQGKHEAPFFLYFCTTDPHRGDPVSDAPLAPNSFGNKPEGYPGVTETTFSTDQVLVPPYLPDTKECREELAQYYQSVARMDQGFGRLFRYLKETGNWDNTIIVYISDNGIPFEGAKTNQYQPSLNLPCLVKLENSASKGTVNNAMINWADLTPTFLDYAGVLDSAKHLLQAEYEKGRKYWDNTYYDGFQGRSFKSVLETGNADGWDETFGTHTFHEITMYYPMRTVITREYKLIWNIASPLPYPQASDLWSSSTWQALKDKGQNEFGKRTVEELIHRPEFELYDLTDDPYETSNLAYKAEYAGVLKEMQTKIYNFQERTFDPWILKWNRE